MGRRGERCRRAPARLADVTPAAAFFRRGVISALACATLFAGAQASEIHEHRESRDRPDSVGRPDHAALLAACGGLQTLGALPARLRAAQDCALRTERDIGFEDPQLSAVYAALAAYIAQGEGKAVAAAALPYRRRAFEAAQRRRGPASIETAERALAYARGWILSGRCEPFDPRVLALVDAAAAGFMSSTADTATRRAGLSAAASAYADGFAYAKAADTLLTARALGGADLDAVSWERAAIWSARAGQLQQAADAFRSALAAGPTPRERLRITQSLKRVLFELGDLDALREMKSPAE